MTAQFNIPATVLTRAGTFAELVPHLVRLGARTPTVNSSRAEGGERRRLQRVNFFHCRDELPLGVFGATNRRER
jgi:hypothetical protein